MDKEIKNTLKIIALYTLALLASSVTYYAIIPDVFPFYGISTVYLLILAVFLLRYFYEKTIGAGQLRTLLILIAFLIIFWIVLRGAKYYFFWESDSIRRHIWYMYYIPQISISVFTFYVSVMIDHVDGMKIKMAYYIPAIVAIVMIATVVTNDIHQMVFIFKPDYLNWDQDYSYGALFIPIIIFIYGAFIAAFIVMVVKCHIYYPGRPFWIVILPFLIGTILLVFTSFDTISIKGLVYKGSFINSSEIQCYMSATFLSACIKIGLIPSNESHVKVLKQSSLGISIFDKNGDIKYSTIGKKNDQSADTLTKKYIFRNGYAIWEEDISEINRINRKLSEAYEQLSEEAELIRLENELKEQNAKVKFRTTLYETISENTSETTEMIYRLAREKGDRKRNAQIINFLGAYLKRYANLTIIKENRAGIPVNELYISIKESLKYLNYMGIPCEIRMDNFDELILDGGIVIAAYDLFENIVVSFIDRLVGIYGNIKILNSDDVKNRVLLKLNFEGVSIITVELLAEHIDNSAISIYEEDGITYVTLSLTEGRECYGL